MQAKPKIIFALEPTQKVGLLRCFSLAFDNSKIRLKKKTFLKIIFSNKRKTQLRD